MSLQLPEGVSPKRASRSDRELSPRTARELSPRSQLPEDLDKLTQIFQVFIPSKSSAKDIREICCKAVVQACHDGGTINLQRITAATHLIFSLHDSSERNPLTILLEKQDEKAAHLLSQVLLKEIKDEFALEDDSKSFKAKSILHLFEIYLDALKYGDAALLQNCKKVLGTLVSAKSDDGLKDMHPYFSQLPPKMVKKLWKNGEKYHDSTLKAFCAMLYNASTSITRLFQKKWLNYCHPVLRFHFSLIFISRLRD